MHYNFLCSSVSFGGARGWSRWEDENKMSSHDFIVPLNWWWDDGPSSLNLLLKTDQKVNNHTINYWLSSQSVSWQNKERSSRFSRAAPTWKEKWRLTFMQWTLFILVLWKVLTFEMTIQKHSCYIKNGLPPPLIISVIKLGEWWQIMTSMWSALMRV